jgi:hypothetical protein
VSERILEKGVEFGGSRSQSVAHIESARERAKRKKMRSSNEDMDYLLRVIPTRNQ